MVETIKYEIIREIGKVEIRRYPKIVIAKVEDRTTAFNLLYRFITGENRQKAKVKITLRNGLSSHPRVVTIPCKDFRLISLDLMTTIKIDSYWLRRVETRSLRER